MPIGNTHFNSLISELYEGHPLADKYQWISPYAYCAWNPIKYVDPDGRVVLFAKGTTPQQRQMFYQAVGYLDSHNCGGRHGQLSRSNNTFYIDMNVKKYEREKLRDHIMVESACR